MANSGVGAKRPYSEIEDADDFVPISKRINNINLQGPRNSQDDPCFSHAPGPDMDARSNHQFGNLGLPQNQMMPYQDPSAWVRYTQGLLAAQPMSMPPESSMPFMQMDMSIAHRPAWSLRPDHDPLPHNPRGPGADSDHLPLPDYSGHPLSNQVIAHSSNKDPSLDQVLNPANHILDLTKTARASSSNAQALELSDGYHQPYCPEFHCGHDLPPSPPMSLTPPSNNPAYVPLLYHHVQAAGSGRDSLLPSPRSDAATLGEEMMGMDSDYDPELGETDNPHYYHINRVLFQAHCERMRREGDSSDLSPSEHC